MQDKPFKEMDEAELKAVVTETAKDMERFKDAMNGYSVAVRRRQVAMAQLRDRFGVDAKTGRRIRKSGDLLDRVG